MNALIACRSFFAGVILPDGHDDMASEEADNDLCNLVAAAISVGYLGAFGLGNYFLLAFCKLIYILAAAQHECLPRKMGPKRP